MFLYGDSGNGKSSLVNAGLLPQAQELGFEAVRVRVQPRAGEEIVIQQTAVSDDATQMLPCVLAPDNDGASRVVLSIADFEARVRAASREHQPLIVFDQFEEILTLFDDDGAIASRRALAEMIVRLLREQLPVKVLFAFREDYLGRVKQLLAARPELVDQALRLGPPPPDALQTIIRGPFERHPGHFRRELDAALARRLEAALAERFGSGDVSLSEVQTVCLRLWRSADPQALLAEKGVQGLLEDELGEALDAFTPDLRAAAVALLGQMVTSAGTRNVVSAEDLRQRVREEDPEISPELLGEALDRLERESKLVRRERRRDIYLYEITSEFLVPWISQRREELRMVQERRRERRRWRILGSIAGVLLVVAALVAVLGLWAIEQRREARLQQSTARSLLLAAAAGPPLKARPDVSLALAFEAYRERQGPEANVAVVSAVLEARRSGLRGAFTDNHYGLSDVAFSPDGKTLATTTDDIYAIGNDYEVRLWDAVARAPLGSLRGHKGAVHTVAFSPDGKTLASAGDDKTIRLWSVATRKPIGRLTGHKGPVKDVAFSPHGDTLASAGNEQKVRLWNIATRKQIGPLTGHTRAVPAVAFSPDGKTLASAGHDRTVRLWNVATRKQIRRVTGHAGAVKAVAFSPRGNMLASAGNDKTVRLWSVATRKPLGRLTGHIGAITSVAFSPHGKTLAALSHHGRVRFWNPATRKPIGRLRDYVAGAAAIAFSPDGDTLAAAGYDTTVGLWNVASRARPSRLTSHSGGVATVAFSPTGKSLAAAGADDAIHLWEPGTGKQLGLLEGHTDAVTTIAFSPDGGSLASASGDRTVRLWNPITRKQVGLLTRKQLRLPTTAPAVSVVAVAFSPDANTFATADFNGAVRIWDRVTRTQLGVLRNNFSIERMAFSADGTILAVAGFATEIYLWHVPTRKQIGRLSGHSGSVFAIAFSPLGKRLASVGIDGTVRLWNAATGKPLGRLTDSTDAVRVVAFSPNGKTLATANEDDIVLLWDLATRRQVGRLSGHTNTVNTIAFSPDGKTLASGDEDGTIRIWNEILWRSKSELRATVCHIIVAGISRSDWEQYAPGIPYRRSCP